MTRVEAVLVCIPTGVDTFVELLRDTDSVVGRLVTTVVVILLAVPAAVIAGRVVGENVRGPQDSIDEAVNRYAVLPLFVLLGIALPWHDWVAFGPAAVAFAALILLLRRLAVVLALARPLRLPLREAAFAGWFGPIGISAVFYRHDRNSRRTNGGRSGWTGRTRTRLVTAAGSRTTRRCICGSGR